MALTKIPGSLLDTASGINGLIYPTSDGTAGQFLKTDGSGNLSFATVTGYTDSDVETYLDGGTSTPTFSTATVSGTLTVVGDLDLTGDINSYNVTDLDITDQTITLGAGQTEALSGGSGIIVDGSGASILWDETTDGWVFNKQIAVNADDCTTASSLSNIVVGEYADTSSGIVLRGTTASALNFEDNSSVTAARVYYNHASGYMSFNTEQTERMRIGSAGDVGIGTDSPVNLSGQTSLTINGSVARVDLQVSKTTTASIISESGYVHLKPASGGKALIGIGGTDLVVDSSGNVGIGTNSPQTYLHVYGNNAETLRLEGNDEYTYLRWRGTVSATGTNLGYIGFAGDTGTAADLNLTNQQSGGDISIRTNSGSGTAEVLRIDSSGNVGIGTTGPYFPFNVYGANASNGDARTTALIFDTTSATTGTGGGIAFGGYVNGTSSEIYHFGNIQGIKENSTANNWASAMLFSTRVDAGNPTERMRIDSSGNVGIGTSSPGNTLEIYGTSQYSGLLINGSSHKKLDITTTSGNHQSLLTFNTGSRSYLLGIETDNTFMFRDSTSATNRMLLLPGRSEVLINRSSGVGAASSASLIVGGASDQTIRVLGPNSAGYSFVGFFNGSLNQIGSISNNGNTNTSFNTSSDYRLKQNVNDNWDATSILKQLRPVEFTWIADDTNAVHQGFLAHEVQEHLPFAVTGEKDAVQEPMDNGEGGTIPGSEIKGQEMDYAKVVPLLVKTIQELEARITELENA